MKTQQLANPPIFQVAADTIRLNIESGRLGPGTVLLESALAELMQSSRAPIKRALSMLEEEALVSRFEGRGYIVGSPGSDVPVNRLDLRTLDLEIAGSDDEYLGLPNWVRLHDEVEAALSRCLVFGQYRIVENLLAEYYHISRTVVRDILGRLQERGIVAKSATSRWIVRPLTAQTIKDKFELRIILEVAALRSAVPLIDKTALESLVREIETTERNQETLSEERWFYLVNSFIDLAILSTPNADLSAHIANNRKALQALQKALFALGLPADTVSIKEIRMIAELLLVDAVSSAANMLDSHLAKSRHRTIAQLKIVAVMPRPTDLVPYVIPS
jgi:DNA-binding GntR family transcriptional regulator